MHKPQLFNLEKMKQDRHDRRQKKIDLRRK